MMSFRPQGDKKPVAALAQERGAEDLIVLIAEEGKHK